MIYIMGEEPIPNLSPSDFRRRFSENLTEQDLADAFAASSNKFWWVEDNEYDYGENTPEHKEACAITNAWGELMDFYKTQIFGILRSEGVAIPDSGQIVVLKPFMMRNGYIDGQGWWIRVAANMVEAVQGLSDAQITFICEECNIAKEQLMQMDEDALYDVVCDTMCDIEIAEVPSTDDEEESERCIMASDIVTLLGNALVMSEGFYYEQNMEELDLEKEST